MKIIALDQSTTAVGMSLFEDSKLVNYMLIKPKLTTSKKVTELMRECDLDNHIYLLKMPKDIYDDKWSRITIIVDTLKLFFEKEHPDIVYFEDVYESKNRKGFQSLSILQGFVAHLCHDLNIAYEVVNESKWIKSWGKYNKTIKRKERKLDVMKKVNDLYGLNITVDDLSDSIAIGKYATEIEC